MSFPLTTRVFAAPVRCLRSTHHRRWVVPPQGSRRTPVAAAVVGMTVGSPGAAALGPVVLVAGPVAVLGKAVVSRRMAAARAVGSPVVPDQAAVLAVVAAA